MNRTKIRSWTAFRVVLVACAAVFGMAGSAAAQDTGAEAVNSGVVVKIHGVSVTSGLGASEAAEPLRHFFALLVELARPLIDAAGAGEGASDILAGMGDDFTPQRSDMDYVITSKGNRMRVDMGGSSLLAALTSDGSVAEWAVLDPASGRVIGSDMFDAAVVGGEAGYNPYGLVPGVVEILPVTIIPSGETREIQGFIAHSHDYEYSVHLYPAGKGENVPMIIVLTKGQAWIAEDSPDVNRDVATVFRAWAQSFGNQGQGATLAKRGLLLAASDTLTVRAGLNMSAGKEVVRGFSSFEVTEISRQPVDDELLSGFEKAEKPCDCSCAGAKKLQAIGKLSKEEQEKHPEAMTLAMCMPKCVSSWMKCDK